ncbi:MAG: YbjQ family protein [Lachnospiraceae bacterium]|nr:YbjQ family protein [Lachnospiraceae bacterium]
MFEGNPLEGSMSSYYVCGNCHSKIRAIKQKDNDVSLEFQTTVIPRIADEKLREYLLDLYKTPEEKNALLEELEAEKRKQEELIKKKKLEFDTMIAEGVSPVLLTTGYHFEGHKIAQYIDIISGECVLGTGFISELGASLSDLTGTRSELFSNKLKEARKQALLSLQESCYMLEGNAIIGIDFDYVTFINNMVGVIASGTAVVVEKID